MPRRYAQSRYTWATNVTAKLKARCLDPPLVGRLALLSLVVHEEAAMNAPVAMRSTGLASLAVLALMLALAGAAAASRGPVLRVAPPNRVYHLAKPVTGASRVPIGDTYGGATSAGDPLVVQTTPKGKAIARIVDQWFASCTSGKTLPFASALPAASKQAPTVDAHGR